MLGLGARLGASERQEALGRGLAEALAESALEVSWRPNNRFR